MAVMDPNEALRMLREAIEHARRQPDNDTDHASFCVVDNRTVSEIIDAFTGLDEWLSRGGFLPEAWDRDGVGWLRTEQGPRPGHRDYDDDSTEF